jgi:hypothetical protein
MFAVGIKSRSISSRFASISTFSETMPVRFPPGRLRLATSPASTGSTATWKTIGIVVVAAFNDTAERVPLPATTTASGSRTSSSESAGNRSIWPCAALERSTFHSKLPYIGTGFGLNHSVRFSPKYACRIGHFGQ